VLSREREPAPRAPVRARAAKGAGTSGRARNHRSPLTDRCTVTVNCAAGVTACAMGVRSPYADRFGARLVGESLPSQREEQAWRALLQAPCRTAALSRPANGGSCQLPVHYAQDGNRVWVLPGAAECKTWWRNLCDGAEVDLTLAGRCLHVHSVVLDQKCEPELTEGVSAYLRDLPHARQVMRATRPTPAETATPLDTAMTKHRREVV
jgi:hypothetical protein